LKTDDKSWRFRVSKRALIIEFPCITATEAEISLSSTIAKVDRYTTFLIIAFSLSTGVLAAPRIYPEVIPGPGLPSLISLNLTSTELYKTDYHTTLSNITPREESTLLAPRFNLNCDGQKCQATDAVACINYLAKLGGKTCNMQFNNNLHQALLCSRCSPSGSTHQAIVVNLTLVDP
jgi:hypothetical protein